jgi:hypothetical protein
LIPANEIARSSEPAAQAPARGLRLQADGISAEARSWRRQPFAREATIGDNEGKASSAGRAHRACAAVLGEFAARHIVRILAAAAGAPAGGGQ